MWIQLIFCFRKNSGHRICFKCLVHNLSTFQVIRSEHGIQYSNILTATLLLCWFHLVKVHLIKLIFYQFLIIFYVLFCLYLMIIFHSKYIRLDIINGFDLICYLNRIWIDVINFDWKSNRYVDLWRNFVPNVLLFFSSQRIHQFYIYIFIYNL